MPRGASKRSKCLCRLHEIPDRYEPEPLWVSFLNDQGFEAVHAAGGDMFLHSTMEGGIVLRLKNAAGSRMSFRHARSGCCQEGLANRFRNSFGEIIGDTQVFAEEAHSPGDLPVQELVTVASCHRGHDIHPGGA
jgi:hypothetical protein